MQKKGRKGKVKELTMGLIGKIAISSPHRMSAISIVQARCLLMGDKVPAFALALIIRNVNAPKVPTDMVIIFRYYLYLHYAINAMVRKGKER